MASFMRDDIPHALRPSPTPLHPPGHYPDISMRIDRSPNVDEGFSEEGRSPSDSECANNLSFANYSQLVNMLLGLPVDVRRDIAQSLVHSLPNAEKEGVKALIEVLTHFDPSAYFPSEIMLQILSYLPAKDLLTASTVSRSWRAASQDELLWECSFALEGWKLDRTRLQAFERYADNVGASVAIQNVKSSDSISRTGSRKRKTEEAFNECELAIETAVGRESGPEADEDDAMEDIREENAVDGTQDGSAIVARQRTRSHPDAWTSRHASFDSLDSRAFAHSRRAGTLKISPSIFRDDIPDRQRLSWSYLYKQRRRLEANWDKGLYRMFQIPHSDHPEEGHEECVYTIQHSSRHLVSGSRDKTIRVWDLNTCRLRRVLRGHEASVLCMQFDERPEHDIIVSGGSDAYVIIWRFSDGKILKKMTNAHTESVLNLRFDDRYIVTCSKDKSIKIWNRRELQMNDNLVPAHMLSQLCPGGESEAGNLIQEYSLLASLTGHNAAVNAVIIHENTIVSASGDRTIKRWDIDSGKELKSYTTHTKGIACVQYDGRRIVSGSSDNTVRIFDAECSAEVACLTGHTDLVRTVQARFGDLEIMTTDDLAREALAADRAHFEAVRRGHVQPVSSRNRHTARNAGSKRPEYMETTGARIPPGGGGTRWAKIVSGSYDETVILWKRDYDGKWQVKHRLRQDMLLRAASRRRYVNPAPVAPTPVLHTSTGSNSSDNSNEATAGSNRSYIAAPAQQPSTSSQPSPDLQPQPTLIAAAREHAVSVNALLAQPGASTAANTPHAALSTAQNALSSHLANGQSSRATARAQPAAETNTQRNRATAQNTAQTAQQPPHQHQTQQNPQPAPAHQHPQPGHANPQNAANQQNQQHNQNQTQNHHRNNGAQRGESNRVFKLQFDARRILCCSQNRIIVGWDFANGDRELERIGDWSIETA